MIGALVLIISAVVLITACSQANSNQQPRRKRRGIKPSARIKEIPVEATHKIVLMDLLRAKVAATIIFLIIKFFGHGMMAEFSKRKY